jgi:PPOX class probable F420-dependent enzyme
MSRRDTIRMDDAEVSAFLEEERTLICATHGPDGWPHLMPLWYVLRDGELWSWTYAASQKVKNLERDPRASVQVEAGEQYHELRGVLIKAEVELRRDLDDVAALGGEIFRRYGGASGAVGPEFEEVVRQQASKRVALRFAPVHVASWDHRKLGGVY